MIQIITTPEGMQEVFDLAFAKAWEKFKQETPQATHPLPPATRQEGSKFLGLSLPTFDTLLKTNQIKSFRIGRQVRIDWKELERYLEKKGAVKHG